MVIFDQLRISDNGKLLYIDAHVNKADYFEHIYLKSITIVPANDSIHISETSVKSPSDQFIYYERFEEGLKEVHLVLGKGSFDAAYNNMDSEGNPIDESKPFAKTSFDKANLSSDLFFVYIECEEGPLVGCPPCTLDELVTVGVTFDENLLYQRVMDFTKDLADDCTVPQGFVDFILLWNAFKSSVETDHYIPALKYYKYLFGNTGGISTTKGCGCHG